jgi:hypothetical protein
MKVLRGVFLTAGFIILFMAGASGLIIAGIGPGTLERAVATLAAAVAGVGLGVAGAMLARSS